MNNDVEAILKTLRNANLAWLADQIANTISNGRVVSKEYRTLWARGRKRKGTKIEPLSWRSHSKRFEAIQSNCAKRGNLRNGRLAKTSEAYRIRVSAYLLSLQAEPYWNPSDEML
jgi:hypothetical protein